MNNKTRQFLIIPHLKRKHSLFRTQLRQIAPVCAVLGRPNELETTTADVSEFQRPEQKCIKFRRTHRVYRENNINNDEQPSTSINKPEQASTTILILEYSWDRGSPIVGCIEKQQNTTTTADPGFLRLGRFSGRAGAKKKHGLDDHMARHQFNSNSSNTYQTSPCMPPVALSHTRSHRFSGVSPQSAFRNYALRFPISSWRFNSKPHHMRSKQPD